MTTMPGASIIASPSTGHEADGLISQSFAAHRLPPLLPFLLAYMSGICGFFAATRFFIVPYFLPLALLLIALYFTRSKTREFIIVLFLAGFGFLAPALPDLTRSPNHILNHIQEGQTTSVTGKIFSSPRILKDRT